MHRNVDGLVLRNANGGAGYNDIRVGEIRDKILMADGLGRIKRAVDDARALGDAIIGIVGVGEFKAGSHITQRGNIARAASHEHRAVIAFAAHPKPADEQMLDARAFGIFARRLIDRRLHAKAVAKRAEVGNRHPDAADRGVFAVVINRGLDKMRIALMLREELGRDKKRNTATEKTQKESCLHVADT